MHDWNMLADNYLCELELFGRQTATIVTYRTHLQRFIKHLQSPTPYCCTRPDVLLTFSKVFQLEEKSYKGHGSRRLFTAVVHTFLKWCRENMLIPIFSLTFPFNTTNMHRKKTTAITKNDIHKLLSTIRSSSSKMKLRDETLLSLYAFTGIRRAEALTIRLEAYKTLEQTIWIRNKGGRLKSVPVIPELAKTLNLYIAKHTSRCSAKNGKQYLFPGRTKNSNLSMRQANNIFNKWKQTADLPDNLTIHSFRSGFATILYHCSKDMLLVNKALHHIDLRSTAEYIDIQTGVSDLMLSAFASPTSAQL